MPHDDHSPDKFHHYGVIDHHDGHDDNDGEYKQHRVVDHLDEQFHDELDHIDNRCRY